MEAAVMNEIQKVIESAVNRKLTEKEILYIEWLSRMDYETINVFTKLFKDSAKK